MQSRIVKMRQGCIELPLDILTVTVVVKNSCLCTIAPDYYVDEVRC